MQKLIPLLSLLFFTSNLFSQIKKMPTVSEEKDIDIESFTGIITEDYPNGKPKLWKEIKNGKATGKWIEWFPDGVVRFRSQWKDDKGNGKWEYFYPNGQLKYESVYQEDIPIGISRTYYENGQLDTETVFVEGKKNGTELSYDLNGILISLQTYKDGKKVLDKPVLLAPGVISTAEHNEFGLTFTPDGNTIYFCRRTAGQRAQKVFVTKRNDNTWSKPKIASFSTDTDECPHITSDGNRFYFASYRPIAGRQEGNSMDMNIWYMDKINTGWSEPKPLPDFINRAMTKEYKWPQNYETNPTTDAEGNLYYWTKSRDNSYTDIFQAKLKENGTFAKPEPMPAPINERYYDLSPTFSPDGKYLFFAASDRSDSYGGEDIYYSKKINESWTSPRNLGPEINTDRYESNPVFSPDGKYFYFVSDKGNKRNEKGERIWNIYIMETAFLLIQNGDKE